MLAGRCTPSASVRCSLDERRSDARRIAVKVDLDQLRRRKLTNDGHAQPGGHRCVDAQSVRADARRARAPIEHVR